MFKTLASGTLTPGVEFRACTHSDRYFIRLAYCRQSLALLTALGIRWDYVAPDADAGRPWVEFTWSPEVDRRMIELVEFAATVREREPRFGQVELAL